MQPVFVQPVVAYGFGGAAAVPQQWQQPQQPQQPQQWQQPQPQPQPQWQPQQPQQMVGMGGVPVGAVMPMGGMGMPMMPVSQPESWQTVASRGAWVQVDGGLSCVSAGNDGSVWGVNSSQVRPIATAPVHLRRRAGPDARAPPRVAPRAARALSLTRAPPRSAPSRSPSAGHLPARGRRGLGAGPGQARAGVVLVL